MIPLNPNDTNHNVSSTYVHSMTQGMILVKKQHFLLSPLLTTDLIDDVVRYIFGSNIHIVILDRKYPLRRVP